MKKFMIILTAVFVFLSAAAYASGDRASDNTASESQIDNRISVGISLFVVISTIAVAVYLHKKDNKDFEKQYAALQEKYERRYERRKCTGQHDPVATRSAILPYGYNIDENDLPYELNSIHGWGDEFDVYVTKYGFCYHRRNCESLKGKNVTMIHRYTALAVGRTPCRYCAPVGYIDEWYLSFFPNSPYSNLPKNEVKYSIDTNYTEMFFTRTCPHCGHTFKAMYRKFEGREASKLSVICPKCNEKHTFTI